MNNIIEDLTEWFYKLPLKEVVAHDVVARKIRDIRIANRTKDRAKAITNGDVNRHVTMVRKELELNKHTTLVNIKNVGYKLADKNELALTTAKWVKRTVMYADRTYRLVDIVDRKRIPGALRTVFSNSQGNIKTLSHKSRAFAQAFVTYADEQKQIAHKKENTNGKQKGKAKK